MKTRGCNHYWVEDFDPATDAACYNAGFNYRPAECVCTKFGRKKKIKYEDQTEWYEHFVWVPVSLLLLFYLFVIAPILLVLKEIKEKFLSKG